MKKIFFLFVCIACASWSMAHDFSVQSPSGHTLYYNLVDNHAVVTFPGNESNYYPAAYSRPSGNLVIPDSVVYNSITYPVAAIGAHAFDSCSGLIMVNIPVSVSMVGTGAFLRCTQLRSVVLPENITIIEPYTFSGCLSLQSVSFPSNLTRIDDFAFDMCGSLMSLDLPSSLLSIGDGAFRYCFSIQQLDLPDSLESIGSEAFYNCSDLNTIHFGGAITSIGTYAFSDCYRLSHLDIPNTISDIEAGTFRFCSDLDTLEIPSSVTRIGNSAFAYCNSLAEVTIPSSIQRIGGLAFANNNSLAKVNYEAVNCQSMGWNGDSVYTAVFSGCPSLTSLTIGRGVRSIPNYAFMGIVTLDTVFLLADSCEYMGTDTTPVFASCIRLNNVIFGENVRRIPSYAFAGCNKIRRLVFPESLSVIGQRSFVSCSRLSEITSFAVIPPMFEDSVHAGINLATTIMVPCGISQAYRESSGWRVFGNLQEFNGYAMVVETEDYDKGTAGIIQAPDCESASAIIRAVPALNYNFSHWNDGDTNNPRFVTVYSDTVFTAFFEYVGQTQDTTQQQGVDVVESDGFGAYGQQNSVVIENASNQHVAIVDMMGRVVAEEVRATRSRYPMPKNGVYIVRIGKDFVRKVFVLD